MQFWMLWQEIRKPWQTEILQLMIGVEKFTTNRKNRKVKIFQKKLIDVRFEPVTISFKSFKIFQQLIFREFPLYLVKKVIIDS